MELKQKNISFGAKTIYPMMIKKAVRGKYKIVPANFAELSVNSKSDKRYIEELKENWKLAYSKHNYISEIVNNFRADSALYLPPRYRYFITRLSSGEKPMREKIGSIIAAKMDQNKKEILLEYIQSASQVKDNPKVAHVKGAGELAILGLVKFAKEHGFKKITLASVNDSFYDKLGFKKFKKWGESLFEDDATHFMNWSYFSEFIKKTSAKYQKQ